jgi:predicted TIM-barrel fold metal-dependent hydrolase
MYIDCDSDYFPVKFLERVSAKYSHSPRVIRNGDDVRSVLPDGTLIKNQAPKGRWHLDTRDHHVDWEGFDIHVLIPENRELLYTWDSGLGCELARAYNDAVAQDLKDCAHPEKYLGIAWVFLPDVGESCREIERSVKTLGLKAVNASSRLHKPRDSHWNIEGNGLEADLITRHIQDYLREQICAWRGTKRQFDLGL